VAALRRLYATYPDVQGEAADFTVRLRPVKPWRRWFRPSIFIAGDHWLADAAPLSLAHGLLAAEMGMNLQMALGWRRHLLLHASCVEKDGRALLMSGESGSGKSTLAAMLGEKGWRFLGDEFVLVDLVDGRVWPFPRLVSLKNSAIAPMMTLAGAQRFGPLLADTPKGDIRHLVPRDDAIAAMDVPATPALLLFPAFGADSGVRPMDPAEVFVRLTHASTNYVALGEAGFLALTGLAACVPAAAIGYGSGEEALDIVSQLWDSLA